MINNTQIEYSTDDALDIDISKPAMYSGHDLDFCKLTPRNFEVLLYRIFKDKIARTSEFSGVFDNILLMSGVRELGRDCALFYDSKPIGLIQCKRYDSDITFNQAAKEILKFVLYSIIRPDIFALNNDHKFIYYIAAGKGVNNELADSLETLGNHLVGSENLKSWVEKVIAQYTSLSNLTFADSESMIKERLTQLKVKAIIPYDLSGYLKGDQNIILEDFFEIQRVVREERLIPMQKDIDEIKTTLCTPRQHNVSQIISEMQDASSQLRNIQYNFDICDGIHIDRQEVCDIFNWINSDDKKAKNTSIVVGIAGCGKSVIMRDVLLKCQEKKIAVLGLKADMQKSHTLKSLTEVANLSAPIIDAIRQIARINEKVVVIIDQIDALSQYLSVDRSYIATYNQLIDNLRLNPNIKIIISTRVFDLENDPSIKILKNDSVVFTIGKLSKEQLNEVLRLARVDTAKINSALYNLLQTPVNLDIFCRLHKRGVYDISQIRNIYQLYEGFWDDKIVQHDPNNSLMLKQLMYFLSQDMHDLQELHVPIRKYSDDYQCALAYLNSQGITHSDGNRVGFFHQTFYDFVYAKCFVENGGNIIEYINADGQSINIRASLKIILSYLRGYDLRKYISSVESIIIDNNNRFHIQYLVYSILGSEPTPYKQEIDFIEECVSIDQDKLTLFLPLCSGSDVWFDWIMQNNVLSKLDQSHKRYDSAIMSVIYSNLNSNTVEVINYIDNNHELPIFSGDKITNILCGLSVWDDTTLLFVQKIIPVFDILNHQHRHILSLILQTNKQFVFDSLDLSSLVISNDLKKVIRDYDFNNFIKKLIKFAPKESCEVLIDFIDSVIVANKSEQVYSRLYKGEYYDDDIFSDYHLLDDEDHPTILGQLISLLTNFAQSNIDAFNYAWERIKDSKSTSWNYVLAIVLNNNAELHQEKIVYILRNALDNNEYGTHDRLHHQYWQLIQASFPIMSIDIQVNLVNIINEIRPWGESRFIKYDTRIMYPSIGRTRYCFLRALPIDYIKSDQILNRQYGELSRKYGDNDDALFDWDRGVTMASYVMPPLPALAYEKMSIEQWHGSFLRFNDKHNHFFSLPKGGKSEHASAFKNAVNNNPKYYFQFVCDIQTDNNISESYKRSGLWGLIESGYSPEEVIPLFIHYTKGIAEDFTTMLMARTLYENTPSSIVMFDFIEHSVASYKSKDKDVFDINFAINNVQGAGVSPIIYSYENKELHDRIFNVLFEVAENGYDSSKLAILFRIAFLNYIDSDRAFELLLKCTNRVCDKTIESIADMLRYFWEYFEQMQEFYNKAIDSVLEIKNKRIVLIYLIYAWLENKIGADILYNKALLKWGNDCSDTIIDAALTYISNPQYCDRCLDMLLLYIDVEDDNIAKAYSCGFLRHKKVDMLLLQSYISRFIQSKNFSSKDKYFYDYLFEQSIKYPCEVLNIMSSIDFNKMDSNHEYDGYRINETRTRVVLSALNRISNSRKKIEYTIIATDIVDNFIANSKDYHRALYELDNSLE